MIDKQYQLTVKATAVCEKANDMIAVIDALSPGESAEVKTFIYPERVQGQIALCIDSADIENIYGFVKSCTDESGDELDDALVEKLISAGNYEVLLKERNKKVFSGVLNITKDENGASAGATGDIINAELDRIVQEKVEQGIDTKENIEERIAYMRENRVDEFLIMRVVRGYRKYRKPCKKPDCLYVDPFLQSSIKKREEPLISEILRLAVTRSGIIFEGEKSVGKNVCATTIAWLMMMPERLFTGSRQLTTGALYGDKTTDNSALDMLNSVDGLELAVMKMTAMLNGMSGKGVSNDLLRKAAEFDITTAKAASTNIVLEDTELVDWLYDGGILIFNEMNLCEANLVSSFLNPILDGTGYLTIPGRGEVPINPDCVLIATQNADYVGVEEQNEATMSRMACERFRQPESIEGLLVNSVKAALKKDGFEHIEPDMKYIRQIDQFYNACIDSVEQGLISNAVLNIRGFVRALAAVYESDGHARLKRQVELNVINTCPLSEGDSLRGVMTNYITL